jgi:hypothetical protein
MIFLLRIPPSESSLISLVGWGHILIISLLVRIIINGKVVIEIIVDNFISGMERRGIVVIIDKRLLVLAKMLVVAIHNKQLTQIYKYYIRYN